MKTDQFLAPMTGIIIPIETVEDETFSDRILGDGFAIEINGGEIVSPFSGTISAVFPTGHAICIVGDNGIQVMIHIGLDTHKLKKNPYKIMVSQGQHVLSGQLLIKVDYKEIRDKATSYKCPIVFLNNEKVTVLRMNERVNCGENRIVEIYAE